MQKTLAYFILSLFIYNGGAFRINTAAKSSRTVEEERPHHHRRHHGDVDREVDRLRRLDRIIGRIEDAAISRESEEEEIPEVEDLDLDVTDVASLLDHATERSNPEKTFEIIALPSKFRRYDLNGDDYITPVELADSTGTLLEDSVAPFEKADRDGDGLLTKEEFHQAPWVFSNRAR
uniref:EF-hand domain-containing protein n=1 Tax=Ciona savignyi TaxID=51511 RepID=H2YBC0_CIOSA